MPVARLVTLIGALMCTGSINLVEAAGGAGFLGDDDRAPGVRRTGSHDDRPVTMVVVLDAGGPERSTR